MSLWINYGYYDNSFPRKNIIIHIRRIIIHIIHIRFLNISLEKLRSIRIILCKQSGKAERVSKEKQPIHFLNQTILCLKIGVCDPAAGKGHL